MTRGKSIFYVLTTVLLLIVSSVSSKIVPSPKEHSSNYLVKEKQAATYHESRKDTTVASNRSNNVDDGKLYDGIEEMPSFPGGDKAMFEYLAKNIQYSDEMNETCVQGRVIVSFFVEKDGSLTDFKVTKSLDPAYDKEVLRVIKSMPKWIPGKQNGVAVRVRYFVPVNFRLE